MTSPAAAPDGIGGPGAADAVAVVPARPAPGPHLVVPFYVNPVAAPSAWVELAAYDGRLRTAVVNVHNGPGAELDVTYVPALASVPPGIRLIGYVPTGYGRRSDDDVRRDAALWRERYGIAGLMLDEVATAPAEHDRLVRLVDGLRADGATQVVGNPGTVPTVLEVIDVLDLTCVFEGSCSDYLEWADETVAPFADRTWHLVHSCDRAHTRAVVDLARRRGAGSLWVSTHSLPHPWAGLNEELFA